LNSALARAPGQRLEVANRQFPGFARTVLRAFGEDFGREQFVQAEELKFYRIATACRGGVHECKRSR
jgi:hypothetical protein